MGILTGLFKTMMLTRMINAKQHRLTQVMSKITRKQRKSSQVERMFGNRLNAAKQQIRARYTAKTEMLKLTGGDIDTGDDANLYKTSNNSINAYNLAYMTQVKSEMQAAMQAELEQVTQQIEDKKEMYLEDLKDEETQLENEKAQLETQIKMYEQWKQASQEETQSSIKNFKPLGSGSSYA